MRGVLLPSPRRAGSAAGAAAVRRSSAAALRGHPPRPRTASCSRSRSGSCSAPCACARAPVAPVIAHVTLNTLTFLIAPLVDDPTQAYTPQPALGLALPRGRRAPSRWPLLRRAAAAAFRRLRPPDAAALLSSPR